MHKIRDSSTKRNKELQRTTCYTPRRLTMRPNMCCAPDRQRSINALVIEKCFKKALSCNFESIMGLMQVILLFWAKSNCSRYAESLQKLKMCCYKAYSTAYTRFQFKGNLDLRDFFPLTKKSLKLRFDCTLKVHS